MVEEVFAGAGIAPAEIDRVAVTIGPGSFTGLRVGVAFAKGFASALGAPCLGVGTLEALVESVPAAEGTRIGVVDGQGRIVYGDQILLILATDLFKRHAGATVIADVKSSQAFFDEIARLGGQPLMYKTGHSLVKAKMAEVGAPLAGEMSGHIFYQDGFYGHDDALYVAVRLLDILARGTVTMAELKDRMPVAFNTPEIRFDCPEERKFGAIAEIKAHLAAEAAEVNDIDGVRVRIFSRDDQSAYADIA